MKELKIIIPTSMLEKINEIVKESEIFDNHQDVILHAITDLLEEYKKKHKI